MTWRWPWKRIANHKAEHELRDSVVVAFHQAQVLSAAGRLTRCAQVSFATHGGTGLVIDMALPEAQEALAELVVVTMAYNAVAAE